MSTHRKAVSGKGSQNPRTWPLGGLKTGDSGITELEADRRAVLADLKHLLSLERTVAEFKRYVAADSASEPELIKLFIAPYLIALALALRISKTSAELFDRLLPPEE